MTGVGDDIRAGWSAGTTLGGAGRVVLLDGALGDEGVEVAPHAGGGRGELVGDRRGGDRPRAETRARMRSRVLCSRVTPAVNSQQLCYVIRARMGNAVHGASLDFPAWTTPCTLTGSNGGSDPSPPAPG